MANKTIAIAAVLVAAGLGLAWYLHVRNVPVAPAARTPAPPPAASEPAIQHPVPQQQGEDGSPG